MKEFLPEKTFHYRTNLKNLINKRIKDNNSTENNTTEISSTENDTTAPLLPEDEPINNKENLSFLKRIKIIFSYYNELGDEFSFYNCENNIVYIKNEDNTEFPVFLNVLLLGKTGAGKSTLINLILEEKKSLEGGLGSPTTSKNILVYKKAGLSIRFYDVKGIENDITRENYIKILKTFAGNNKTSYDTINAIFYCKGYTKDGTFIDENDEIIFESLINFDFPIIFVITKTEYDPKIKSGNTELDYIRQNEREKMENNIKDTIRQKFEQRKDKEKRYKKFMENCLKIYYVNLVKYTSSLTGKIIPIFGIDKVLSYFKNLVSEKDWENLEKSCKNRDSVECKKYCDRNPFMYFYSDPKKINERNKAEALDYLKTLKVGAIFTGAVPGADIAVEYLYRYCFTQRLTHLYNYDFEKAQKEVNKSNKNSQDDETQLLKDGEEMKTIEEIKSESKTKLEKDLDKNIANKKRNTFLTLKRLVDIGFPVAEVILFSGLRAVCIVFLPITSIVSSIWSYININKDCKDILDIFEKAFINLQFDTIENYARTFRNVVIKLELIGKKYVSNENSN